MSTITIEIGSKANRNLYFPPIGKVVRGRFDVAALDQSLAAQWPTPIPGQLIGLDLESAEGWVSDPLVNDDEHEATRELIKKRGMGLGPEREEYPNAHLPSWLQQMIWACESGDATLVAGKFPDKLPGKPKKSFVADHEDLEEKQSKILDRLAGAIDKLADAMSEKKTK